MTKATKKLICLLGLLGTVSAGCASRTEPTTANPASSFLPTHTISIHGTAVSVQVAHSPAEQQRGLSGIPRLQENEGMLFLYAQLSQPTFWMKDMLFPIDIIWIRDGRVIGIDRNIQPPNVGYADGMLTRYTAPSDVTAVLEMRAGWAAAHAIQLGSTVTELTH